MDRRYLILGVVALLPGCASILSGQTARTLGRGHFEIALTPSVEGSTYPSSPQYLPDVSVGVAGRYGVTDALDVGAAVGQSGILVGAKVGLLPPGGALQLSLAPTLDYLPYHSLPYLGDLQAGWVDLQLPLLLGIETGGGSEFVLGARLADFQVFSSQGNANYLMAGVSAGYRLQLAQWFALQPELGLAADVGGTRNALPVSALGGGIPPTLGRHGLLFQFALGFVFGSSRGN